MIPARPPVPTRDIASVLAALTREEKVAMVQGSDFWHLAGVERLGIPSVMVSDGPHGLRQQSQEADHLGVNDAREAVCFPTGAASASSFDPELMRRLGETIGREAQARDLAVVLGPAINIKRSPLCGRNFEYLSEDPYLSSTLAAAYIEGVQKHNVGTSPKHFVANNQETRRMTSSSNIDERALREIYLASFERAVEQAAPWTIMSSYNRVNGTYVGESRELLTGILRDVWGFSGVVVSDWGAVSERVASLKAGLDLEMPASGEATNERLLAAMESGELDERDLDTACRRILELIFRYVDNRETDAVFDPQADHVLARQFAAESIVLLDNPDNVLPLEPDSAIAFIGEFATSPRFQGGGSSHISTSNVTSAVAAAAEAGLNVTYARGYDLEADEPIASLVEEAVATARAADVAVVFAGLPDSYESEGYDRRHLDLPRAHNELIAAVAAVQPRTVVVLHNGSPVSMPWRNDVAGIVEAYLGGEAIGGAVVDILTGAVNPSGRLAETFPLRIEDTPAYLTFGRASDDVSYNEGVFVGYRYYASIGRDVLFPFGHGLSYTTFEVDDLTVSAREMGEDDEIEVSVRVTNTGERAGKEVVQLYVASAPSSLPRPVRELRGFDKVELAAGASARVHFRLSRRAFAHWDTATHDWAVEGGTYGIEICANAHTPLLRTDVAVTASGGAPLAIDRHTRLGDLLEIPSYRLEIDAFFADKKRGLFGNAAIESEAISHEMIEAMMLDMPLRQLASFNDEVGCDEIDTLIARLRAI
ncbi:MAG: glycoside hydrolase family 3 C-terminal domain-containing protein [Actinomycetaceae bacterium]|nr:glycoside hydrolase family 3 C-terminal domain-containing protein [Actinomycetaceae bacterium]